MFTKVRVFLGLLGLAAPARATEGKTEKRPNIIIIVPAGP